MFFCVFYQKDLLLIFCVTVALDINLQKHILQVLWLLYFKGIDEFGIYWQ